MTTTTPSPEARERRLSDHRREILHYGSSILRQLQALREIVTDGDVVVPNLGSEILADNIDWLDCFVDMIERGTDAPTQALLASTAQGDSSSRSSGGASVALDGWRPIESAPKDGTKVVVLTRGKRALIASWQDGYENAEGSCGAWTADEIHPPCWTDGVCWASNADDEPSDQPTHWRPLPAPPSSAEQTVQVLRDEPIPSRAERLVEGLRACDDAENSCPIQQNKARASEVCPKCGATDDDNCGPAVRAAFALEETVRSVIAEVRAIQEGEDGSSQG